MDKKELMAGSEIIKEIVSELQKMQLGIPVRIASIDELKQALSGIINHLITNDFSRLIALLYRLDISEKKLRQFLNASTNTSSSDIIANMIIERQEEKIKTRKLFSANNH
jgi:hypothetical protein